MREMVVVIKDDFDRTQLADRTMQYAWNGTTYEIDLTADHAAEFEALIAPYIAVSRKAKRKATTKPAPVDKTLRDKVRDNALKQGIKQAASGHLRQDAIDAWLADHPQDAAALGRTP